MQKLMTLVADETRYQGWVRVAYHALLWIGIAGLVGIFYLTWFEQGGFTSNVWAAYGREVIGVILQYYVLLLIIGYYLSSARLIIGLLGYYWLIYTYYFTTAVVIYQYTGLDDFSGAAYHFITNKDRYWQALFSHDTLFRLVRFPILLTIFPLVLKAGVETYRRQVRNARLQQQYTQLELDFLKTQVNPHFLFNILNSIYALTEEESPRAARLVAQLSSLMRYTLYETADTFVPLIKELAFVRDYVALEQTRTAKRLTLEIDLPKTVDERLQIAPFILITFVENAFKHGVESTTKKSWVKITVGLDGETLRLNVANSKPAQSRKTTGGLGLANARKRLALLYPDRHTLLITDQEDSFVIDLQLNLNRLPDLRYTNRSAYQPDTQTIHTHSG